MLRAANIKLKKKGVKKKERLTGEAERYKDSMSCPTRPEYIFYISKGWALKINPVILSLHDLT